MATSDRPSFPFKLHDLPTLLGSWFGVGFLPLAPGTWASMAAVPLAWLANDLGGRLALGMMIIVTFAIGVLVAEILIRRSRVEDAPEIVIDEVVGQWIVLLASPTDLVHSVMGFILFRVFDIFKPWPVSWADRRLKGGIGTMADDVIAGVLAGICLWLFARFGDAAL